MDFGFPLAQAIATADEAYRRVFIGSVKNTIYLAFSLMDLQASWLYEKADDRTQAVIWSMKKDGSAMSAYYSAKYQVDDQTGTMSTAQVQNIVSANQTKIDTANDARKGNLSMADGFAAMLSTTSGIIRAAGA